MEATTEDGLTFTLDRQADFNVLPNESGVYIMRDLRRRVVYVGKATSFRSRVQAHFFGPLSNRRFESKVASIELLRFGVDAMTAVESRLIARYRPVLNVQQNKPPVYQIASRGRRR